MVFEGNQIHELSKNYLNQLVEFLKATSLDSHWFLWEYVTFTNNCHFILCPLTFTGKSSVFLFVYCFLSALVRCYCSRVWSIHLRSDISNLKLKKKKTVVWSWYWLKMHPNVSILTQLRLRSRWSADMKTSEQRRVEKRREKDALPLRSAETPYVHLICIHVCLIRRQTLSLRFSSKPANDWLQKFIVWPHWFKDEWTYYALKRCVKALARQDSSLISPLPDKRQHGGVGGGWGDGGGWRQQSWRRDTRWERGVNGGGR